MEDLPRHLWSWSICNDRDLQEFQALVIDFAKQLVVLKRESEKWVLPGYLGGRSQYQSSYRPQFVIKKVQDVVNGKLSMFVLRQIWREEMDCDVNNIKYTNEKAVVLVEAMKGNCKLGNGFEWVPLQNAIVYHLFSDAEQKIGQELTLAQEGKAPEKRLSWQRPGWMSNILQWTNSALLQNYSVSVIPPVTVERSTPFGIILVLKTAIGVFYLKCTSAAANDAAYSEVLSSIVPRFVAKPMATDAGKQVMLNANYGRVLQPYQFSKKDKVRLTQDFARLQQDAIGKCAELSKVGMPDFSPSSILETMDKVLLKRVFHELQKNDEYCIPLPQIHDAWGLLREDVLILERSQIPPTDTHNDLYFSNVYKKEDAENFMFFDWVEGYIGHPFTSYLSGLEKAAYLQQWRGYGRNEDLKLWLHAGQRVRHYIVFALRLREAEVMEEPEASESLEVAGDMLLSLHSLYCC